MDAYEQLNLLGSGSFGHVFKIRRRSDNKIMVWKELNYGVMSEREKGMLVSEVNILRELKHPNIVRYYDRIINRDTSKIYIVMEYCESGDLASLLKQHKRSGKHLDEAKVWNVFFQIVLAIHECHTRPGKILHRDIKPANIFIDKSNTVKLGDFGLARVLGENSHFAYTNVGTPFYMSPEQVREMAYNEKSDMWSLGCLLHEMCSLSPPFEAANQLALATKIRAGRYHRIPSQYSEELQRTIDMLLRVEPERRASVEVLLKQPEIAMRMRERRFSSQVRQLKTLEDDLKQRETTISDREKSVAEKEKVLSEKEKSLTEREKSIQIQEKSLVEREKLLSDRERESSCKPTISSSSLQQQQQLAGGVGKLFTATLANTLFKKSEEVDSSVGTQVAPVSTVQSSNTVAAGTVPNSTAITAPSITVGTTTSVTTSTRTRLSSDAPPAHQAWQITDLPPPPPITTAAPSAAPSTANTNTVAPVPAPQQHQQQQCSDEVSSSITNAPKKKTYRRLSAEVVQTRPALMELNSQASVMPMDDMDIAMMRRHNPASVAAIGALKRGNTFGKLPTSAVLDEENIPPLTNPFK